MLKLDNVLAYRFAFSKDHYRFASFYPFWFHLEQLLRSECVDVSDKLRTLPAGIGMLITQAQAIQPYSFEYPIIKIGKAEAGLAGLIALFPVLVIFLVAQRLIVRGGATVGSVKG